MTPSLKDLASNISNFFQQFSLPGQNQYQQQSPKQDPRLIKMNTTVSPNFVNAANAQQPPPQPVMQQQASADPNFRFAFETMKRDPVYAQIGPRPNFNPVQPPANIGEIFRNVFPNEATKAATLAVTENSQYDPIRPDAVNRDEAGQELSRDRGLFQINNKTFNGEMDRYGDKLRAQGINSYEDMYDAKKNAQFAKHLLDAYGAGRWFGWQDTGYDLNNDYYSAPRRIDYELKKRGRK